MKIKYFQWGKFIVSRDMECVNCGSTKNLHAHHIIPSAQGGKDRENNGITLCKECHKKLHGKKKNTERKEFKGKIIDIHYRNPEEITELLTLRKIIGRYWTQGAIYMCGLRYVANIVRKAKNLGNPKK